MLFHTRVLLLIAGTIAALKQADASKPSVYFADSPYHSFFMAPHLAINRTDATHILSKNVSNCTCKHSCFAVDCKAFSVVKLDNGTVECRLDNEGPMQREIGHITDATYFFKQDTVAGTYTMQKDGLLYVELSSVMNYDNGKAACESIPGHRLIIIKTLVQYEYFKSLWTGIGYHVVVDLKKVTTDNNGMYDLIWGDGTRYNETELDETFVIDRSFASYYIFANYHTLFYDWNPGHNFRIICQANPLGIGW